jgi:hypothetical protein
MFIVISILFTLSGCSNKITNTTNSNNSTHINKAGPVEDNKQENLTVVNGNYSNKISNIIPPYDLNKAKENNDIIVITESSAQKIYNYSRIDKFISNYNLKKRDNVRIVKYYKYNNQLLVDTIIDLNDYNNYIEFIEYDCKSQIEIEYIAMNPINYNSIKINKSNSITYLYLTDNISNPKDNDPIKIMAFSKGDISN